MKIGPDAGIFGYAGMYASGNYDVSIENFGTATGTRYYSVHRSGGGRLVFFNREGALAEGGVNSSGPMSHVDNAGII